VTVVRELNADTRLREQIRQRDKALRDYENDMTVARKQGEAKSRAGGEAIGEARGEAKGIAKGLKQALANLIASGMEESQARKILGL
jgi:flagellar biosynthesis/type III secretory pathway protein FliH